MAQWTLKRRADARIRSTLGAIGIAVALVCSVSACGGPVSTTLVTTPGSNLSAHSPAPVPSPSASPAPATTPAPTSAPTSTAAPTASPTPTPTPTPAIVPLAGGLGTDTASPSDPNYGQYTLPLGTLGVSSPLTFLPAYASVSVTLDPATCGTGNAAVVTLAQQSANTFLVTSQRAGVCKATVTSASAIGTVMWFTVNQTGFTVN